jgi:hypothetical protein
MLMEKHVNAYLSAGDVCVDVHLSKVLYQPADDVRIRAVVDSITVKKD